MLALILVMVFLVYRFPLTALSYDDHNVLPERAVMNSNVDWLWHLLHFNQTRLTYVGDFALFRPGLFLLYWVGDVLARPERMLLNLTVVALYALTAWLLYLALRRWLDPLLAFGLCLIFVYPNQGYALANAWHIAGYFVSIVLYVGGFLLLDRVRASGMHMRGQVRSTGAATLALFLSTLFHEFAVVALIGSCLLILAIGSRKRAGASQINWPIIVALGGYLLLYGINWLWYPPPQFWSPQRAQPLVLGSRGSVDNSLAFLIHAGTFLWPTSLAVAPSLKVLPAGIALPTGGIPRVVVAIVALAPVLPSLIAVARPETTRAHSLIVVASVMGALTLVGAVSFGRLPTGGTYRDYYYPLVGIFLIMIAGQGVGQYLSRISDSRRIIVRWILIVAVVPIAIVRGIEIYEIHQIRYRQIKPELSIISVVASFFQHSSGLCHAGLELHYQTQGTRPLWYVPRWIITDRLPSLANIETALQYFGCGIRGGRPVYTSIRASHDLTRIEFMFRELRPDDIARSPVAIIQGALRVEPFDQVRIPNIFEASAHQNVDNRLEIVARTREPIQLNDVRISFHYHRQRRILYHFGIRVRSVNLAKPDSMSRTIAFIDTVVRSWTGSSGMVSVTGSDLAPVTSDAWARWIPMLPASASVTFRRNSSECLVFLNQYFLGTIAHCEQVPVYLEILQWSNGTPGIRLDSTSSAPAIIPLHWSIIGTKLVTF